MKKLVLLLALLKKYKIMKFLLGQYYSGYLKDIGWFESFENEKPVDGENNPLPWVTYPFIEFIKPRLQNVATVFEFGSGNSTLFYSRFVNQLVAVEHDKQWYEHVKFNMPDNVNIKYEKLEYDGQYCRAAASHNYDLIIIDGRDRTNCIYQSINSLTSKGCIVLDDSERDRYQEAITWLTQERGFKKIDFWGISPGLFYLKNTTIFYRNGNVLNI